MKIKLIAKAYHRNGVSGEGFTAVLFRWQDDNGKSRRMLGILFGEESYCAILDVDETAAGNIDFGGGNSWRGDHFEESLRAAIGAREEIQR